MRGFIRELGIDFGTSSTRIYERGRGIVLNEPTVAVLTSQKRELVAVGNEAKALLRHTPGNIVAARPLKNGVVADFELARAMLKLFLKKVGSTAAGVKTILCAPCGLSAIERRNLQEAAMLAGAREVYLMDAPLAAAVGADLPVSEARGSMVVSVGGGTSEVAVLSLGGIVESETLRFGGCRMDEVIKDKIRRERGVYVGDCTAEYIKEEIGSALAYAPVQKIAVSGRSLETGLPVKISIPQKEIREAIGPCIQEIMQAVLQTLSRTPPELIADIAHTGITVCGAGGNICGLCERISRETGIKAALPAQPELAAVRGAGRALEDLTETMRMRFARSAAL